MATNNILSNLKNHTISVTEKLRDNVTETASKAGLYDVNKQKMKPFVAEKAKMYEFIGMEVFDLYVAGKMNLEVIEPFCKKIEILNTEIVKLENEIAQALMICECGEKLQKGMKFCSSCGKSISEIEKAGSSIVCECGAILPKEANFCTSCGKNITRSTIQQDQTANFVECVCGAIVESGSQMCMDCGRRIVLNN